MVTESEESKVTITFVSSVSRPLGTPSDQVLPNDAFHLQYYDSTFEPRRNKTLVLACPSIVYIDRPHFDITSRPVRAAVLALASLSMPGDKQADVDAYYTIFYQAASESIAKSDVVSLMYASYVMAILSCIHETSTYNAIVHCAQFCRTLKPFSERGLSATERYFVKGMWNCVVRSAYFRYWFDQYYRHGVATFLPYPSDHKIKIYRREIPGSEYTASSRWNNLADLAEILSISASFLDSDVVQRFDPIDLQIFHNSIYIQILVECCLFESLLTEQTAAPPPKKILHSMLIQTIDLIDQSAWTFSQIEVWRRCFTALSATNPSDLPSNQDSIGRSVKKTCPNPGNFDIAVIYITSRLLLKLLCSDLDQNKSDELEARRTALATVHLFASATSQFLLREETGFSAILRRTMFWSGLVLYKMKDTKGNRHHQF